MTETVVAVMPSDNPEDEAAAARLMQQVLGPQLLLGVLHVGRFSTCGHLLLGSTDEALGRMGARLVERFEGVELVGLCSPPFCPLTAEEIADQDALIVLKASRLASMSCLGVASPTQTISASDCRNRPAVAVGAAFEFTAGALRVAPNWMQRAGLEWVFRLASEPRRLWRRYLFGNVRFVWAVPRRRCVSPSV